MNWRDNRRNSQKGLCNNGAPVIHVAHKQTRLPSPVRWIDRSNLKLNNLGQQKLQICATISPPPAEKRKAIIQENENPPKKEKLVFFQAQKHIQALPESNDWLDVYRPKALHMVLGREAEIEKLQIWLREFAINPRPAFPMALFYGRPGTGKTTVAHLLLKSFGYEVVEVNASDTRSYANVLTCLDRVCLRMCVTGKQALLLEEIDGTFESETGKSSIRAIVDFLTANKTVQFKAPIICTCNETHKGDIKSLFGFSIVVPFWQLYPRHLLTLGKRIANNQQMIVSSSQWDLIVQLADGDARQVIQSLRLLSLGTNSTISGKDEGSNIFEAVKKLLNGRGSKEEAEFYSECNSYGIGLLFENYTSVVDLPAERLKQCDSMQHVCDFADAMSAFDLADTFDHHYPCSGVYFAHEYVVAASVRYADSITRKRNFKPVKCSLDFFKPRKNECDLEKCFIEEIDPTYFDCPLVQRLVKSWNF
jgi:DNA polymerase III delta prime subunit